MGQTLQDRVENALKSADHTPYDTTDAWYNVAAKLEEEKKSRTRHWQKIGRNVQHVELLKSLAMTEVPPLKPRFIGNALTKKRGLNW